MRAAPPALAAVLLAGPLAAQQTVHCLDHPAGSLAALPEPIEDFTRSYADGAVRIILAALGEPACCGAFPVVLLPDPETSQRLCNVVVPDAEGQGYGSLAFGPGEARYEPDLGLVVPMTAEVWTDAGWARDPLEVSINQQTGEVRLR